MASRNTRKPVAAPKVIRNSKAATLPGSATVTNRIDRLPGAVFFGALYRADRRQLSLTNQHFENVEYAERLQRIRDDYEEHADEDLLYIDCQEMGFESNDIRRFATNAALITDCGYFPAVPLR
jgi:hypothetical protein